jgi:hypothetical protein
MLCTAQEQALTSINSITVNITGYCRFRGRVAGHIPFANEGQTQESLGIIAKKRGCREQHKHLIWHCA